MKGGSVTLSEALAALGEARPIAFAEVFAHGSLTVEIFAPQVIDTQQPHSRDEAYIVIRGSGEFLNGAARSQVAAGDFLFVPAGVEHRFEDFSDDLLLWVIFYGPEGGETEPVNQAPQDLPACVSRRH
jgi:mannose-6-phosphate isomerase-like protein (cupin superfamily)